MQWYVVFDGAYESVREVISRADYSAKYYHLHEDYRPRCKVFASEEEANIWADNQDEITAHAYNN